MVEIRHPLPRHGTDHDSKPLPSLSECFVYQHAHFSADEERASKWPCDRAKVRPQSARAAICRSPRLATNSAERRFEFHSSLGVSSSSFCTPCGASTVVAAALFWHSLAK